MSLYLGWFIGCCVYLRDISMVNISGIRDVLSMFTLTCSILRKDIIIIITFIIYIAFTCITNTRTMHFV